MTETIIFGDNFYGIPKNGIDKIGGRWIPIFNVKFKTCGKHHYQTCPECGKKKKNIRLHYRTYHKRFYYNTFIRPLKKAQVGYLYGVKFYTTKRITSFNVNPAFEAT